MANIVPLSEVSKHTSPKDVWMAIDGQVFNITAFLEEHPGGPEILLEHAGKDATKDFDEISHSKSAREMMKKYYVGDLPAGEGVRSSAGARAGPQATASGTRAGEAGGSSVVLYLIPVALLAFGLWYQFLRTAQ